MAEYYGCYLTEVISVIDAFYELEDNRYRQAWEQARLTAFYSANSMFFKKPIKKQTDLLKLKWDKQRQKTAASDLKRRIEIDRERQLDLLVKWRNEGIVN